MEPPPSASHCYECPPAADTLWRLCTKHIICLLNLLGFSALTLSSLWPCTTPWRLATLSPSTGAHGGARISYVPHCGEQSPAVVGSAPRSVICICVSTEPRLPLVTNVGCAE